MVSWWGRIIAATRHGATRFRVGCLSCVEAYSSGICFTGSTPRLRQRVKRLSHRHLRSQQRDGPKKMQTRLSLRSRLRVLTRSLRTVPPQEGTDHRKSISSASDKRVRKWFVVTIRLGNQRLAGYWPEACQPARRVASFGFWRRANLGQEMPPWGERRSVTGLGHLVRVPDRKSSTRQIGAERGSLMINSLTGSHGIREGWNQHSLTTRTILRCDGGLGQAQFPKKSAVNRETPRWCQVWLVPPAVGCDWMNRSESPEFVGDKKRPVRRIYL